MDKETQERLLSKTRLALELALKKSQSPEFIQHLEELIVMLETVND
jgi:hypothetical protein